MKFTHHPNHPKQTQWFVPVDEKRQKQTLLLKANKETSSALKDVGIVRDSTAYLEGRYSALHKLMFNAAALAWLYSTEVGKWLLDNEIGFEFRDWTLRLNRKEHAMLFKLTWC